MRTPSPMISCADAIAAARRGSPTALAGYRGEQAARFGRYCATRSHFYGLERRWPATYTRMVS